MNLPMPKWGIGTKLFHMSEKKDELQQNPEEQQPKTEETAETPEQKVEAKEEAPAEDAPKQEAEKPADKEAAVPEAEAAEEEKKEEASAPETETEEGEEAKEEPKEEAAPALVNEGPHDDFDWDNAGAAHVVNYTEEEYTKLLKEYESTFSHIQEGDIVKGKVTAIQDGDVVLDINYKSDGLVSLSEFRDMEELKPGDEVEVYVEQLEDEHGQLQLSRRKAKLLKAWEAIRDSYENGTIITGKVVSKTKGGLIVDCSGLETFLPGSQIDIKPIVDYDQYVGKTMEFRVVKINERIKNAVVSHKALIESDLAEQREQIIAGLEKGQVLEGVVKNITDFGAFMDLGGVDGLLYITDISWGRINHPSEVLKVNQKMNVVVLEFDENKKRISLGLKQLQPHPWEVLPEEIKEGAVVKGKIVNIEDYGAFLEILPGVEGLIHVSEVSWSNQQINARDFFKLGEERDAKIVTIDRDRRKISLSIKQLTKDPWEVIEERYPVGSRHKGVVNNLTNYGVFVRLDEGIGGMIHVSDLSWTKRYAHPKEFVKEGEEIEVVILDIDKENRKLSLGHKQLEEDPWDTFEEVFPVGSYHEATVLRKDDRGAILQLPYGLEAYSPLKHLRKEDGTMAEVDEVLTVKVIEFNRDDKRIMVSHLRYLEDIRREADESVRSEKREERKSVKRAIKKQQSSAERSTLGDLDVFSQLKEQLKKTSAPKKEEPKKEEPKAEEPKAEEKSTDEGKKEE